MDEPFSAPHGFWIGEVTTTDEHEYGSTNPGVPDAALMHERGRPPTDTVSGSQPRRITYVSAAVLLGAAVGAVVRGFFPPFVLDEPFWRDFWSGPPVAGLFAVCAATIAFFPACRATRIAGASAAREQWWKRAEWALGQASSDSQVDREVANDALQALLATATRTEASMILRTLENLQHGGVDGDDMDSGSESKDNLGKRRWLPWRR